MRNLDNSDSDVHIDFGQSCNNRTNEEGGDDAQDDEGMGDPRNDVNDEGEDSDSDKANVEDASSHSARDGAACPSQETEARRKQQEDTKQQPPCRKQTVRVADHVRDGVALGEHDTLASHRVSRPPRDAPAYEAHRRKRPRSEEHLQPGAERARRRKKMT